MTDKWSQYRETPGGPAVGATVELRCADGETRVLRIAEVLDGGEPGLSYVRGYSDDRVLHGAYVQTGEV